MDAKLKQQGDVTIVTLTGRLDVEKAEPFRRACLNNLANRKVIFNLNGLSFVGSSGITPFLKTIQDIAKTGDVRLCHVGLEFKKLIHLTVDPNCQFFENELAAFDSLISNQFNQTSETLFIDSEDHNFKSLDSE